MRIGYGEDTHRLTPGRKLILAGVEIPFHLGLLGHSDADLLTHAVMDALLGAAGLPDIGCQFPDNDPAYAGIASMLLLERTIALIKEAGFRPVNVDATIVAQAPKLIPHREAMINSLQGLLGCPVNVKATTPEGLGPEGNLECITARAVCLLECV